MANPAVRAATRSPVSVAPAFRTSTAMSGSASSVIWLPRLDIENADQSFRNSGSRQREARASAACDEIKHFPHAHIADDRLAMQQAHERAARVDDRKEGQLGPELVERRGELLVR